MLSPNTVLKANLNFFFSFKNSKHEKLQTLNFELFGFKW